MPELPGRIGDIFPRRQVEAQVLGLQRHALHLPHLAPMKGQLMKPLSTALSTILLLVLSAGNPDASARSPQPRVEEGFIERIDQPNRVLQFRRSKESEPLLIVWNSLTRFVKNSCFVSPGELRVGTPVTVGGSMSQRNAHRRGFQVAYTRTTLVRGHSTNET